MEQEEAASAIRAIAARAGFEVTLSQLRRWHKAGLIGAPRQQGLGRARGTETLYPAGTTTRVLEICRVMRSHRSLRDVAWALWWDGGDVDQSLIRAQLVAETVTLRKHFEQLIGSDGPSEEAEALLDRADTINLPSRALRWARRRVGAEGFDLFLDSLLSVAAGQVDRLQDTDLERLEHGLGFDAARRDPLTDGEPWLTGDRREDFIVIGRLLDLERIDGGLAIADSELNTARDEAKDFAAIIRTTARIIEAGFGRWGFGFPMMGAMMDDFTSAPEEQRRFLLLWLSMRTPEFAEGMQAIVGNAASSVMAGEQFQAIVDLLDAVPAVGAALSVSEVAQATFDPEKQQRLQLKLQEIRTAHGEEIDRFFQERERTLPPVDDSPGASG